MYVYDFVFLNAHSFIFPDWGPLWASNSVLYWVEMQTWAGQDGAILGPLWAVHSQPNRYTVGALLAPPWTTFCFLWAAFNFSVVGWPQEPLVVAMTTFLNVHVNQQRDCLLPFKHLLNQRHDWLLRLLKFQTFIRTNGMTGCYHDYSFKHSREPVVWLFVSMTTDNPGPEKGGGGLHSHLDHIGKLTGRPAPAVTTGPGSLEGMQTYSDSPMISFRNIINLVCLTNVLVATSKTWNGQTASSEWMQANVS